MKLVHCSALIVASLLGTLSACGSSDSSSGPAGTAGSAGSAGTSSTAGASGSGTSGSTSTAGASGSASGSAGSAGASGSGGSSGVAGSSGSAGSAGSGGGAWMCYAANDGTNNCTCGKVPNGTPMDTCQTPKPPCCVDYVIGSEICSCTETPSGGITCQDFAGAVTGTVVTTCPPP